MVALTKFERSDGTLYQRQLPQGRGRCGWVRTDARLLATASSSGLEVDWRAICCPRVKVSSDNCVGASVSRRILVYGAVLTAHCCLISSC